MSAPNSRPEKPKPSTGLESVITLAASVSMAAAAAFLVSLKQVNPEIKFHFSVATIAASLLGGIFTFVCFKIILNRGSAGHAVDDRVRRRWLLLFALVASLGMFAAFAIAMRNLSPEKRSEVLGGTAIAVAVLSVFGWLFWRVVQFFDPDARRHNAKDSRGDKDGSV